MTATTTEPKFLIVNAETGEQVRESRQMPSVLLLKQLLEKSEQVDLLQQDYFRTKDGVTLNQSKKAESELREIRRKTRVWLQNQNLI